MLILMPLILHSYSTFQTFIKIPSLESSTYRDTMMLALINRKGVGSICRRLFATSLLPLISIKAMSPVAVRAVWSDEVIFPSELIRKQHEPTDGDSASSYILEESLSALRAAVPIEVSVPRRCRQFRI